MCYRLVSIEHQVRSSIRHSWSRAFIRGLGRVVKFWKFYPWLKQYSKNCYIFNKGQLIFCRLSWEYPANYLLGIKLNSFHVYLCAWTELALILLSLIAVAIMSNILSSRLGSWFQLCFCSTYIYKKGSFKCETVWKKGYVGLVMY